MAHVGERLARTKPIIGLAGGIGAGKSTVAKLLGEHQLAVIDSDQLNHQQLSDPEIVATLVDWFGPQMVDAVGQVRRDRMAKIVFDDPKQKARVEELLHPRVQVQREQLLRQHLADPTIRAVVLDSPLLFEVGLDRQCDCVVFVDAPDDQRLARVATERGWTAPQLRQREKLLKPTGQ